ncbi:Uncharacterised protein [Chlamydia trachomatis]|nr:Uncharacterised protein [Chlamydia trachomatis]
MFADQGGVCIGAGKFYNAILGNAASCGASHAIVVEPEVRTGLIGIETRYAEIQTCFAVFGENGAESGKSNLSIPFCRYCYHLYSGRVTIVGGALLSTKRLAVYTEELCGEVHLAFA